MLALQARLDEKGDQVIIRDADGAVLCEVWLIHVDRGRVRWGFIAPDSVKINRRAVDETVDWTKGKLRCPICKDALEARQAKDSSGLAHAWRAEREKRS